MAVFDESGIVDNPDLGVDQGGSPLCQDMSHGFDFARGGGHELWEALVVDAEAFGHGVHGFSSAFQHQSLQVVAAGGALVLAG